MTAVLVVTGPVGVGKSAVLAEADVLLASAGVSHATVVMEEIARYGPAGPDDPWNERSMWRNLAALWSNYSARGAERLLLEKLVAQRSQLRAIYEAIPDAKLTIVRLRAPQALLEERISRREPYPDGELSAARRTAGTRRWVPARDTVVCRFDGPVE